jgi:NADH-quinone oxidoreductase subunit L
VAAHIHESPRTMTVPLMALAAGSVVAGWLGTPKLWNLPEQFRAFELWLAPAFSTAVHVAEHEGAHDTSIEWILMALSVAVAVAGIAFARQCYHRRPEIPDAIEARCRPVHRFLLNKWYVDELYDFLFVNGFAKGGGRLAGAFDQKVVDGGVNGAGWLTRFSSRVSIWWDTWIIDGAVRFGSFSVKLLSYPVCILQTGRVQAYALFVVVGALAFFGYYLTR